MTEGGTTMLDFKKLRETAMRETMKLMGNPRVMKMMSNPRVMKVMMQAFQLRSNVDAAVDARVKRFAKKFKLATREEVAALQATIKTLEAGLQAMQSKVESNGSKRA